MNASVTQRAEEILANFSFLDGWEEKYQYIIDLGKSLPAMENQDKTAQNLVQGCMSQVWLKISCAEGKIHFSADSDAIIVRGLIAVVRALVEGAVAKEVAQFDFQDFFRQIGLDRQLSPNRRNGLVAFVGKVHEAANT